MSELDSIFRQREPMAQQSADSRPHAIGSPLPMGRGSRPSLNGGQGNGRHVAPAPPGRALNGGASASSDESSGLQRAMHTLRMALPIVQRLLPLLDGNIGTAISNLVVHRSQQQPQPAPAPPPPKVDLAPLEDGLAALQTQHRNLREQVMEQVTSLKRVENQLEMVREATDRNTLEQQELLEDLKLFGNKVKIFAFVGLGLIAVGILLNLAMFLHIRSVLPLP
jgi:hypothetical protein